MSSKVDNFVEKLKDPRHEIQLVRDGLKTSQVQSYLNDVEFPIKDILKRLHISSSTYFTKRKSAQVLDAHTSEKFIRLILVVTMATNILGKEEAKKWLYQKVPSLGNEVPLDLLDTEAGHRMVSQALLQIKHGIFG